MSATKTASRTIELLDGQADNYLNHECNTIDKGLLHLPGPDFVDNCFFDFIRIVD